MLKMLDLFSGIGGFSLAASWTNKIETKAFCEIDPFCQQVLRKHWPNLPIFDDVKTLTRSSLNCSIDIISGGFPCQDISVANKVQKGLEGQKSGLWFEYLRLIKEFSPKYVVIENVSNLRNKGLNVVLQNLSEVGYDAEWHCIPASHVGAPHQRDRIWILAYPQSVFCNGGKIYNEKFNEMSSVFSKFGNNYSERFKYRNGWVFSESAICRKNDGVPKQVDRLRALGNAIVPQVVYPIFKIITEMEERHEIA